MNRILYSWTLQHSFPCSLSVKILPGKSVVCIQTGNMYAYFFGESNLGVPWKKIFDEMSINSGWLNDHQVVHKINSDHSVDTCLCFICSISSYAMIFCTLQMVSSDLNSVLWALLSTWAWDHHSQTILIRKLIVAITIVSWKDTRSDTLRTTHQPSVANRCH